MDNSRPIDPSPIITSAQPKAQEQPRQPPSERQAGQQKMRDERDKNLQSRLSQSNVPPLQTTPLDEKVNQ